jgi:RecA/RadA recombinase
LLVGRENLLVEARSTLLAGGATRAWVLVGPPGSGRTRMAREIAIEAELSGKSVTWADSDSPLTPELVAKLGKDGLLVLDDVDTWDRVELEAASLGSVSTRNLVILATSARAPGVGDGLLRVLLTLPSPPSPTLS